MQKVKFIKRDTQEEIPFDKIAEGIIAKINSPQGIETTKGKHAISALIDVLINKEDPFITALGVLGADRAVNAFGLFMFICFQLGSLANSSEYELVVDTTEEEKPETQTPEV